MTPSERSVKEKDINELKSQIHQQIKAFEDEMKLAQESLVDYFDKVTEKLKEFKHHKENINIEIKEMEEEIKNKKEEELNILN